MQQKFLFFLIIVFHFSNEFCNAESFYELLGVSNDADIRTIRKAFKKLAIVKHPDKNTNDPNAHAEFVRINRAYEVLKDEDLRKKYDEFGEEGLNNNFNNSNQQYQSWQFYRDNFGIYDEDVEIVTLSRSDFQDEVFDSNDFWFINFYSTFCSHCHAMAPAWREFAKQMDGIIKIGAVNCAEDPVLCQSQHVMGYPSLVVYPEHTFYQGPRDTENLINFIVSRMTSAVYNLNSAADVHAIGNDNGLPFIIEFCGVDENCLPFSERKKVASLLSDIANFGVVHCATAKIKCSSYLDHGFAFYPLNGFQKSKQKEIEFVELNELYALVLRYISNLEQVGENELKELLSKDMDAEEGSNILVLFFKDLKDEDEILEYKKLRTFFPNVKIKLADCSLLNTECTHRLHFKNLPKAVLFRKNGAFDVHYENKFSVRKVKNFLRKSLSSSLFVMADEIYEKVFEHSKNDLLVVDYFAPWCPPCLRLINELRNLPATVGGRMLRVATLDCETYKLICSNLGIKSYPTSVLYVDGKTFSSTGFHTAEQIIEFIEESLNPSAASLTYESFQKKIIERTRGHVSVVDFYVEWCGPCQQLAPEFRKLARSFRNNSDVSFGMVDCEAQRSLCNEFDIRSYPAIRLFDGKQNYEPKHYPSNWWRDFKSMQHWVNEQLPSLVEKISGNFHTDILGSKLPILVDYYAPWCGHCVQFAPILESIAKLLEGEVRVAKVNCDMTPHLCQMASVQAYPSLRLYLDVSLSPSAYGIAIQPVPNAEHIVQVVSDLLERNGARRINYKDEL